MALTGASFGIGPLTGIAGASLSAPTSPGVQAASPTKNVTPPKNTLTPAQTAAPSVNDLSSKYANVDGTIYNKGTGQGYSDPNSFFKDSGVNSFNNLKFDTAWTPPTVSNGNLQMPGSPAQAQTPTPTTLPALAASNYGSNSNTTSNAVGAPTTATGAPATSVVNGGNTGVSQGGIIGGLINNANNNPAYQSAIAQYNSLTPQIGALQASQQNQITAAEQDSGDMGLSLGRQGMITQNTGGLINALVNQQQAALGAANAAQGEQGQTTTGLGTAGNLNAPITGVQPGTVTIQPSQPNGSTTSGAPNVAALVGTRLGADGKTTEYYNKSTGVGFSTPQQLADFVNQQNGNNNATAANVFSQLNSSSNTGSGTIVGGNSALNPIANIPSIAQQVVNGTLSYQDALNQGGSVSNFSGALNQAITSLQPGFNFNTAQGNASAQTSVANNQAQTVAQYTSAKQQASNLTSQFTNLLQTYGLNPSDINVANGVIQKIAANTSDSRYSILNNYLTDIASTYANILSAGGSVTDQTRSTATGMLNSLQSGQSLQNVIAALDQQAQAKIAGTTTQPATNPQAQTSGSSLYDF